MLIPVLTVNLVHYHQGDRQKVESGGNVRTYADVTESHLSHKSVTDRATIVIHGFRNSRNFRSLKDIPKAIKYTAAQGQLS